jgi:multiple sugar transport system permease protein
MATPSSTAVPPALVDTGPAPARRPSAWRKHRAAYLMCAPTIVLFLVFMVFPIGFVLYTSMLDWNGIESVRHADFIGLDNFRALMHDDLWWKAVRNTLLYAFIKIVVELPLALLLAVALNSGIRGLVLFRTIGFIPVVTSVAVVSLAFTFFFSPLPGAAFNTVLQNLGIIDRPIAFLGEREYAFWTVTGVAIWHDLGINMVFFLAALQTVPRDLYDAAKVDGASATQRFFQIEVPVIRPLTAVIISLSLAGSLKVFDIFSVLTAGGPGFSTTTMVLYMFRYTSFGGGGLAGATSQPQVGYGSAVAVGLGLIIFAVVLFQQWINRTQDRRAG